MKAIVYHAHGDTSAMALEEIETPQIGPKEVLLKVTAAALNGFDPQMLLGQTELKTPFPMIPLGDMAGEVVEVGADVGNGEPPSSPVFTTGFERHKWKPGDRVSVIPFLLSEGMSGETRPGCAAEFVKFPAENLIPIPDEVSDEQAAALPIAYGTAYRLVYHRTKIRARQKVLILGATGGVGVGCAQMCKNIGAEVIAVSRDKDKLERMKALGVDHIIDTSTEDLEKRCHEIAGRPGMMSPKGVDVVVNFIGGESWSASVRTLKHGGTIVTCGATAGYEVSEDLRYIWSRELHVIGSNGWMPMDQLALLQMTARGDLDPVIDSVRPLEKTPEAIQDLIDRKIFGKAIIKP